MKDKNVQPVKRTMTIIEKILRFKKTKINHKTDSCRDEKFLEDLIQKKRDNNR